MGKSKPKIPSIYSIKKFLMKDNLLPIYFFCGEDVFTIDNAVKAVRKSVEPLITSDFDKETISVDKSNEIMQIMDLASAFPFGSEKKLIVVKNFENISNKKGFADYVNNPAEFTVLVVTQSGKTDTTKEPYASLYKHGYIFEANHLKGSELAEWIVKQAKSHKLNLNPELARALMEIVGEDKSLLEMQLNKLVDFVEKDAEITIDTLKKIASTTKQHSIFDLQDALGKGDKARSLNIAYNLLDGGQDIIFILTMLTRFISTIAQSIELVKSGVNDNTASRQIGVSYYYYINCRKARMFMSDDRLLAATRALLKADYSVKTSATDPKSIVTILISELLM